MVYFEVEAGLCNRMRGTAAAYFFAKEIMQPLTILWKSDVNCNLRFDDIFSLKVDIPVKVINFDCMGTNPVKRIEHQINKCREAIIKHHCDIVYHENPMKMDKEKLVDEAKDKSVYLKSCYYWYEGDSPFSIFILKNPVAQKIKKIIDECGKNCVGVHIRRTDHRECIAQSPTEAFIREMKKEPDDTIFYIATDDANERENIVKVFGKERIRYNESAELERGTIQGMEDAVVDLYVLAGMRKILGSDGSSFTETAGMIHGTPVVMCKV